MLLLLLLTLPAEMEETREAHIKYSSYQNRVRICPCPATVALIKAETLKSATGACLRSGPSSRSSLLKDAVAPDGRLMRR